MAASKSERAGGAVTTGVPRRYLNTARSSNGIGAVSPWLFDPEFAPALGTDFAVDQRAGARLLEQGAVAALLIIFRRILVSHGFLIHLCRRLPHRQ